MQATRVSRAPMLKIQTLVGITRSIGMTALRNRFFIWMLARHKAHL